MPPSFSARGGQTRQAREQAYDRDRGTAAQRGYDHRWSKAAKGHLSRSPLCVYCACGAWGDAPRVEAATLVDHFYPHGGDRAVFWATAWWVSSCKPCHDGPKQAAERRGRVALDALARLIGLAPRG